MTVLLSQNFETLPDGAITGVSGAFACKIASSVGKTVPGGVRGMFASSDGETSYFDSTGALGDQGIRTAQYIPALDASNFVADILVLRSDKNVGGGGTHQYNIKVETNGTALRLNLGATNVTGVSQQSAYFLSPASTDVVHTYAEVKGNRVRAWMWVGTTMPTTPSIDFDTTGNPNKLDTGFMGVTHTGAFTWHGTDNVVLTDGAGGEDFFYSSPVVTGVTVAPSTASVAGGTTQTFTATVTGTGAFATTVNWTTTAGSITSGGVLTAPTATGSNQTVTVTATSTQDGTKSGTATVTVPLVSSTVTGVTVSPSSATVTGGSTQTFTAVVAGTLSPSQAVAWSATAGSITSGGVFTAPAATGSAQTVTVTATSSQNNTKAGTATVTVPVAALVTFTPACVLKSVANATPAASVAIHAFVHDLTTGVLVGTKTGLMTSTAGLPPAFTASFGVPGTAYDVKFVDDANPLRRSLERIVPV